MSMEKKGNIVWFRSWHGAPTDNKWLLIARKANVIPGIVSAVAWALMDYASQAKDRGSVKDFDAETYAAFSGFAETDIASVIAAMHDKNVIDQDERLTNWDKRQPKREDDSAERVKASRARQRAASRDVTQGNAESRTVTQGNAREDSSTTTLLVNEDIDKSRVEESRGSRNVTQGNAESRTVTQDPAAAAGVPADDFALACNVYQDNIGLISPMIADKIKDDLKEYPVSWFVDAVEEAVTYNVRRLPYVESILERWQSEGKGSKRNGNGNGYARNERERDPYKGARELK